MIEIRRASEGADWSILFRPLASKRCDEFLLEAGVPTPLATDSEHLRRAAREFIRAKRGLPPRPPIWDAEREDWREGQAADLTRLLTETLARLEARYGEGAATAFATWGKRHVADQRGHWSTWSSLLPWLAAVFPSDSPPDIRPLPTSTYRVFRRIVLTLFGKEVRSERERRFSAARNQKLSRVEALLLAYDPGTIPPGGPFPADDLDIVAVVIGEENAFRVTRALLDALRPGEIDLMLSWARNEGPRHGISTATLTWG